MKWRKTSLSELKIGDKGYINISDQFTQVKARLLPLGISKQRFTTLYGGGGSPIVLEFNNREVIIDWELAKLIEVKI